MSSAFNNGDCTSACSVLTCSCTAADIYNYWSSSTDGSFPTSAWNVDFNSGFVVSTGKIFTGWVVRAVRGGL